MVSKFTFTLFNLTFAPFNLTFTTLKDFPSFLQDKQSVLFLLVGDGPRSLIRRHHQHFGYLD
ncbi:hypothetical protein, partial [Bacteroides fluxus]|uniref:hypothetical protein n=1 Tax=Bacteroides fluxus TaxID=626930 RepID=UPI0023F01998